ncbi:MAG TPA: hypothetical protein VGM62_05900 [Chthoniobacterales bacterium]|jgi:hypothetical protein
MKITPKPIRLAIFVLVLSYIATVQATVYVTADDLNGTNLFGTLDVATGQFTQITTTTPLFFGITTGQVGQLYGADVNSGNLFTISPSGMTATLGSFTAPSELFGLAYSNASGNFFAENLDSMNVTLYSVAGDGNSSSTVGVLAGPDSGIFNPGNLAFGPGLNLYFNYSSDLMGGGANSTLYTVNTSTGMLTMVGSGLGTDTLALFSDGTNLYGVDSSINANIPVYRINTTTGIATQVSTVTGLPGNEEFYIDAVTVSVPETPASGLLLLGSSVLLIGYRLLRRTRFASRV